MNRTAYCPRGDEVISLQHQLELNELISRYQHIHSTSIAHRLHSELKSQLLPSIPTDQLASGGSLDFIHFSPPAGLAS
jgi:hypothetical protein